MKNMREDLARAIGKPFTTRQKIADALCYKDPHSVDKFLKGLPKINGTRYYTLDVVDELMKGITYE